MKDTQPQPNTSGLQSQIMQRIESDAITPRAKYICVLKHGSLWASWLVLLFLSAAVLAEIIFIEFNIGWEVAHVTHGTALALWLDTLPLMWFVALLLLSLVSIKLFRLTKRGYTYKNTTIVILVSVISIGLGGVLHAYGVAHMIDQDAKRFMPFHRPVDELRTHIWEQPERGLYIGEYVTINQLEETIVVETRSGKTLEFATEHLSSDTIDRLQNHREHHLRIVATTTEGVLVACMVSPAPTGPMLSPREVREQREYARLATREIKSDDVRTNPCRSFMKQFQLPRLQTEGL